MKDCVCSNYDSSTPSLTHRSLSLSVIPWAVQSWANYEIVYYAESDDYKKLMNTEHGLVVLNHRGDVDWMIGWCLIEVAGMLGVRL